MGKGPGHVSKEHGCSKIVMQGEAVQGDVEVEVGSGDGEDYGGMDRGGVMTGGTGIAGKGIRQPAWEYPGS